MVRIIAPYKSSFDIRVVHGPRVERVRQCRNCYKWSLCRPVEIYRATRRQLAVHWVAEWLCGGCTAVLMSDEALQQNLYLSTG